MSVAIVDCGGANLRSVATSIERLQIPYVITDNSDEIIKAQYVICLLYTSDAADE